MALITMDHLVWLPVFYVRVCKSARDHIFDQTERKNLFNRPFQLFKITALAEVDDLWPAISFLFFSFLKTHSYKDAFVDKR